MRKEILSIAVLLGIVGILGVSLTRNPSTESDVTEGAIEYSSAVCIDAVLGGEPISIGCSHNVLTNYGKNAIRDALTGGTVGTFDQIGLCNATNSTNGCVQPIATDMNLTNEFGVGAEASCGLTKTTATKTYQSQAGNWSYAHTFTSTCNSVTTNVTGIFNNSVMFAGNNFTSVTLQSSDTLQITWYIWVS